MRVELENCQEIFLQVDHFLDSFVCWRKTYFCVCATSSLQRPLTALRPGTCFPSAGLSMCVYIYIYIYIYMCVCVCVCVCVLLQLMTTMRQCCTVTSSVRC